MLIAVIILVGTPLCIVVVLFMRRKGLVCSLQGKSASSHRDVSNMMLVCPFLKSWRPIKMMKKHHLWTPTWGTVTHVCVLYKYFLVHTLAQSQYLRKPRYDFYFLPTLSLPPLPPRVCWHIFPLNDISNPEGSHGGGVHGVHRGVPWGRGLMGEGSHRGGVSWGTQRGPTIPNRMVFMSYPHPHIGHINHPLLNIDKCLLPRRMMHLLYHY